MEHVGGFIRADNIKDAWYKGLNLIWDNGIIIKDERGGEIKELLNVVIVIQNPNVVFMPSEVNLSTEYLDVDPSKYNSLEELPLVKTGCDSYASWDEVGC